MLEPLLAACAVSVMAPNSKTISFVHIIILCILTSVVSYVYAIHDSCTHYVILYILYI